MTQLIIRQNHAIGGAAIVTGELVHVNPRSTWHSGDLIFDLYWKNATGIISARELLDLSLKSREALIRAHLTEGLDR
ncbi:hypothetical protein [Mycobacterium asiaticum]|uniref:Uncharacterized protein n=1 Tax=Mycobacterium asiaticum TaxID=1790 RepID=A0A1A3NN74_MYCAS|nr:hypothetical protein [Mycobacterium asiaticum]OBK22529.1 hypothetical protein A5635_21675 [Mycobacterium asiaticum]